MCRCCCFNHFCMAVSIPSLWSSSLRAVCSAVWHWRLLAPHYRWALSRFCSSCFVSSARDDFPRDVFALHGEVEAFALAALACKSCSSLFTLLLTTALSIAFVRFWCFFVHSIHSGTFQTNCWKEIVLAKSSISTRQRRRRAHAWWWWSVQRSNGPTVQRSNGPGTQTKIEMASRLVPSL